MEKNKEKSIYDARKIDELENQVEAKITGARTNQKEMIEILIYLKTSGRYKENTRYMKSSFYEYIEDRFNMRQGTFMEMQIAFTRFPEASIEYGVGLVGKVIRLCGSGKAKVTLAKLDEAKKATKTELKRNKIEAIIQANRQSPKIQKAITDWHAMYLTEKRLHDETKMELKEALATIEKLNEQILRLKTTAQRITDIRKVLEAPAPLTM